MSGQAPKRYASRLFQFKIGHGAVGFFLERIWVTETTECWWCQQAEQSVHHLYVQYTKGKKWCRERRVLKEELRAFGIGWQRRPEKRWVAKSTGERASGTTATEISHDYGGRRSRRWSGRGSGMGASNAQTKKGRNYSIIIPSHLKVEVRFGTIYMLPWSRPRNLAHLHSF